VVNSEMRVIPAAPTSPRTRDLARGVGGLALWGAPIALILSGSFLGGTGAISFSEEGILLIIGPSWLGIMCLANARRCGRTHCWIDGTLLPPLAFVGTLILFGLLSLPWYTYTSALWIIVIGAFLAECALGPYRGN
jgi:hypothetical protein